MKYITSLLLLSSLLLLRRNDHKTHSKKVRKLRPLKQGTWQNVSVVLILSRQRPFFDV